MTLLLIVAGFTLLASFTCSLLEAALYAVTPAQIEVLRARGAPRSEALERLRADVEEPIVAILPVSRGDDSDNVVGLVHRRDVFEAALVRPDARIEDLMRPIRFVPESMPAHRLLSLFLKRRDHMVGVLDEHGTFEGVVTLEDVMECLLGTEIVDEYDRVEDMQALARERAQGEDAPADGEA